MAEKIIESKKRCIWMDAGVVQFKLCDKDFDCLVLPIRPGHDRISQSTSGPSAVSGEA